MPLRTWSGGMTLERMRESVILVLGRMLSHSVHLRCKVRLFLALRCCSCRMCVVWGGLVLIERINLLGTHRLSEVRAWTKRVVDSGFIWQQFPMCKAERQNLRALQLRFDSNGKPLGMRQHYFDDCCRNHYFIGWAFENDTLRLSL